jgi:hypothetical protein
MSDENICRNCQHLDGDAVPIYAKETESNSDRYPCLISTALEWSGYYTRKYLKPSETCERFKRREE